MKTNRNGRFRDVALISSTALWAALLITGLTGGVCYLLEADSGGSALAVAAVQAVIAAIGIILLSRVRTQARLQTALDAYAEREIVLAGERRQKRQTSLWSL